MTKLRLVGFPIGERPQTHACGWRARARCGKTKEHPLLTIRGFYALTFPFPFHYTEPTPRLLRHPGVGGAPRVRPRVRPRHRSQQGGPIQAGGREWEERIHDVLANCVERERTSEAPGHPQPPRGRQRRPQPSLGGFSQINTAGKLTIESGISLKGQLLAPSTIIVCLFNTYLG